MRDFSFCGLQEPFREWLHWNTVFRRGETHNIFTREGKILLQTSSKAARWLPDVTPQDIELRWRKISLLLESD